MSNALKSAAESTVHTLSDFVEGARDRIEDVIENVIDNVKDELPPLTRTKRDRHTGRWTLIAVAAVLLVVGMMVRRRSTNDSAKAASTDSTGARLTERSLAVS